MRPGPTLALIPAKAGSRRLPRKNILPLAGRSLLARTVDVAREADLFTAIVVSTEDDEVAREAALAGAEVLRRPLELAVDPAGVVEVALHALDELARAGRVFETLTLLLPTSPLRTAGDVRAATSRYLESGVDFLMSVTDHDHSPLSSLVCDQQGRLLPLHPEWLGRTGAKATGDAPRVVRSNGAVTIVDVERFQKERNYYAYPLAAYFMPRERSIDIDTELDFELAGLMLARR